MVDIIWSVWGEFLVTPPLADSSMEVKLPSLEELRRKILIKVKYTAPEKAKEQKKQDMEGKDPPLDASSSEEETDVKKGSKKPKKKNLLDALSELGVYTRAYHFKSFEQPEARIPTHIFALSEGALLQAQINKPDALAAHNKNYMMRAYPKGIRISSSNLDPAPFWRLGVQLVALNWQKHDMSNMLNQGMFSGSGGWVLKPSSLRPASLSSETQLDGCVTSKLVSPKTSMLTETSPAAPSASAAPMTSLTPLANTPFPEKTNNARILDLSINIIAAQDLPLPPSHASDKNKASAEKGFRPYIKVILHVPDIDKLGNHAKNQSRGQSPSSHSRTSSKTIASLLKRSSSQKAQKKESSSTQATLAADNPSKAIPRLEHKARTPTSRGRSPNWAAHNDTVASKDKSSTSGTIATFSDVPLGDNAMDALALSFVRFKVMDDVELRKDELAGWACIRLDRLQEGVRVVKLRDAGRLGVEEGDQRSGQGRVLIRVTKSVREVSASSQPVQGQSLPMREVKGTDEKLSGGVQGETSTTLL